MELRCAAVERSSIALRRDDVNEIRFVGNLESEPSLPVGHSEVLTVRNNDFCKSASFLSAHRALDCLCRQDRRENEAECQK